MENPMSESINDIEHLQEALKNVANESRDKKTDDDPSYKLYSAIVDSCANIMKDEKVLERINQLIEPLGSYTVKTLVPLLAVLMVNASYQAVLCYDDMLKKEIGDQFELYGHQLNMVKADVDAHGAVLKMFRGKISKLETNEKIKEFKEEFCKGK